MAEQGNPATGPSGPGTAPPARSCRSRRRGVGVLALVFVALISGLAGSYATRAFGHGPGFYGYGWHGGSGRFGRMDPAAMERRAERAIKHLAIEIDANQDQQDKLIAIAKGAIKDLLPLRDKMRGSRQQAIDLFAQSSVDRAAIEKLRADQLANADELSRRIAKAIADAAEVLTPEQRRTITDRIPPPGGWHGRWHRG